MAIDLAWWDAVRAACDPVFAAADAGFDWAGPRTFDADHPSMLWEADAERFAARYPDSGIEQSYGDQWPAPCIDYWVYVDPGARSADLSVEGWRLGRETIPLTGDGTHDGRVLATRFAEILRVAPSRPA